MNAREQHLDLSFPSGARQEVDFTARQIALDWYMEWRTKCDRYQLAAEVIGLSDEKREELEHEGQCIAKIMLAIAPERVSP